MKKENQIKNSLIVGMILFALPFLFKTIRIFFTSKIYLPIWFFALLLLFSLTFFIILFFWLRKPKYSEDVFDRIKWRWGYYPFGGIKNLTSYCLICDTFLFHREWGSKTYLKCENCKIDRTCFDGSYGYYKITIESKIDQKIR